MTDAAPEPVVLETVAALRAWRAARRAAGQRVGLVPTMGALHAGHLSLVTGLAPATEAVVVSIFVNPTQFAPHEDFAKYPRTFARDVALLREAGAAAVFAPTVQEMYPDGFATTITLDGPARVGLEDAFRPTHFAGVATVVAKLLLQCLPERAIFGEKDYQQLAVIRRMAQDLDLPAEILGGPTIREADGLAMSSRNVYLSPSERETAPVLHQVLQAAAAAVRTGTSIALAEGAALRELSDHGFLVDYFAIRDAASLAVPAPDARPETLRVLVAARLGQTRLIDNIAVGG
jgi:pantoate--beta-alanine ligase